MWSLPPVSFHPTACSLKTIRTSTLHVTNVVTETLKKFKVWSQTKQVNRNSLYVFPVPVQNGIHPAFLLSQLAHSGSQYQMESWQTQTSKLWYKPEPGSKQSGWHISTPDGYLLTSCLPHTRHSQVHSPDCTSTP